MKPTIYHCSCGLYVRLAVFREDGEEPTTLPSFSCPDCGRELDQSSLTPRQIEIMRFLIRGFRVREVADELHLSRKTIESHRDNIYDRLGIDSLPGLVRYALENNLATLDDL